VKVLDNLRIIQSIKLSRECRVSRNNKTRTFKRRKLFYIYCNAWQKIQLYCSIFPETIPRIAERKTKNKLCFAVWRKRTTCLSIERAATRFVLARRENKFADSWMRN